MKCLQEHLQYCLRCKINSGLNEVINGQYLGIKSIKDNFESLDWYFVAGKDAELKDRLIFPFGSGENLHGSFFNLDGALEIAVRSKKAQSNCISKMAYQKWRRKSTLRVVDRQHSCSTSSPKSKESMSKSLIPSITKI